MVADLLRYGDPALGGGASFFRVPEGAPGLVWRGRWDDATKYFAHDVVELDGSAYVANKTSEDNPPPNETGSCWQPKASPGRPARKVPRATLDPRGRQGRQAQGRSTPGSWPPSGGSGTPCLRTLPIGPGPQAVAFDGTSIWVTNVGSGNVTKLRASDGAALGTFPVGSSPFGVAFDGTSIWVADFNSGSVTKLTG